MNIFGLAPAFKSISIMFKLFVFNLKETGQTKRVAQYESAAQAAQTRIDKAKQKADDDAAKAKKKSEDDAAKAKKKSEDDAAKAKKKTDDDAAKAKKKADDDAAKAKKKADDDAAKATKFDSLKTSTLMNNAKKSGNWKDAQKYAQQLIDYWTKKGDTKKVDSYSKTLADINKKIKTTPTNPGGGGEEKPPTNPPGGGGEEKPPTNPPGGGEEEKPPTNPPGGGEEEKPPVDITPEPTTGNNEPPARQRPTFVAQKRQYGKGDTDRRPVSTGTSPDNTPDNKPVSPPEKAGLSGVSRSVGRTKPNLIKSPTAATSPSSLRGPGYEPRKNNFEVGRG